MKPAGRVLACAAALAALLAAAPPARACTPLPEQPWFLPRFEVAGAAQTIDFLGPDGGEGYERTFFYFNPVTIRNLSEGTVYLLGSNQLRIPEPLEVSGYEPPPGFEVYFALAPGEAVEARDSELIAIAFGLEDRNIYQATWPAEVAVPEPQEGKIWLVVEGEEQPARITLTYVVNPSFFETDPEACARFLQLESYQFALQALGRCLALAAALLLALILLLFIIRRKRKDSIGN